MCKVEVALESVDNPVSDLVKGVEDREVLLRHY